MVKPKDWTKHSRGERSITVNGRHFFASRCAGRFHWSVEEVDQAEPHGSRRIADVTSTAMTKDLSAIVLKAAGL